MTDGSKITMSMTDVNKDTTTTEEETKVDAEATEEETEEEEVSDEESDETESDEEESEDDAEASNSDNEIDLDAEIERERNKGKPDPKKAKEAFQRRNEKRAGEDDDDKPMTRREMREFMEQQGKVALEASAFTLARGMSGSDKEAQLVVEKWKNRTFPAHISLSEQIEEAYAITHRKKLIGERQEALRALKNKGRVNNDGSTTHHSPQRNIKAEKLSSPDTQAIIAAGFTLNSKTRRFEKKLSDGSILVRDPKTKETIRIPSAK